jgi:hypothetical protein
MEDQPSSISAVSRSASFEADVLIQRITLGSSRLEPKPGMVLVQSIHAKLKR